MSLRKNICTIFCSVLACTFLLSQNDEVKIRNYGFEDGLSHRNVFEVQQDSSGFIWVATAKGLNRFDGHNFLAWHSDDERYFLPHDDIWDILLDDKNQFWIATNNGSIVTLDLATNEVDSVPVLKNGDSPHRTSQLCEDGLDRIWATTYFASDTAVWLQRTNNDGAFENLIKLPGRYENRPIVHSAGLTYVGAFENEIWVFDIDGKQAKQYEFDAPNEERSFSRVIRMQLDAGGTLWAMLDHGQLYYLGPTGTSFLRHPISEQLPDNLRTSAFSVSPNGDLWVGGIVTSQQTADGSPCSSVQPGASLFHYNSATGAVEDHSYYLKQVLPYAEPPRQIFQDRTGVIWIATAFGLVHMVDHDLFTRYMADGNDCCRDGICSMRGITEDDNGNIYFSYYSSLHVLNPRTGSLTPLFAEQLGAPFGILHHQNAIWTGEGLRIDLRSLEVDTVLTGMHGKEGVVVLDRGGKLWFGNGNRLVKHDPNSGVSVDFNDPSGTLQSAGPQSFTYLLQSKKNNAIWAATRENGIFELNEEAGVLRHFSTKSSPALPHDRILAMCEIGDDLWFGSADGLCRLNTETESLNVYTSKEGLPNNFVNGMLPEGDSAIWVSTDNGLSRFDFGTGRFTNFFNTDGLSKNEFNRSSFYLASDGRMYFGGINGVNAFYPGSRYSQRRDKVNSRLVLTDFEKFDGEMEVHQSWGLAKNKRFELSPNDEMFAFGFTLADYSDPKVHVYSYKLEGYDKEWSEASPMNFARYFNIPAGKYRLRVRASRGGGNWVEDELSVPIQIKEAFYKTGWFQILALVLITALVYGIMRYRLYLLQQHEEELETLVQLRTKELENEKRKSDELLLNILPADTAEELKQSGTAQARRHENVTVMFSDFKEFSIIATDMEPEDLVAEIDLCFRAFDEITELHGLEKIKTIGDAYLLAGGISSDDDSEEAVQVVRAALEIQAFLSAIAQERKETGKPNFEARIGIHTGPIVAGIVGIKKFAYDIWGDTVNIAERLQSSGETGKVNISKSTYELVKDHFECTYRGKVMAKNKGEVDMYFVDRIRE